MGLMGRMGGMGYLAGFQAVLCFIVKMLVFRAVWGFRRRITERSPKGRREGNLN